MPPRLVYLPGRDPRRARSGHDTYVRAHVRAAGEAGHRPLLVCAAGADSWASEPEADVQCVASRGFDHRNLHAPAHTPRLVRALCFRFSRRDGPVLLHGFGLWTSTAVRAAARLRRRGVEAIAVGSLYTAHGQEVGAKSRDALRRLDLRTWIRALYEHAWTGTVVEVCERRACRRASRLYVNYHAVARALTRRHGARLALQVLPYASEHAFDRERPTRRASPDGIPRVVAVSRHAGNKGLDVLLRAFALLRRAGLSFRAEIVGGGPLLAAHRAQVAALGLEPQVVLTGEVASVKPHLADADVFVLPSLQEGSGSVSMLEAMEMGLPVVATDVDGIGEDVVPEVGGLLVEPGCPEALARALGRCCADSELRERLAAAARDTFERRFGPDRFSRALDEAYRELGFPPRAGR